jgi:hypothetical protein
MSRRLQLSVRLAPLVVALGVCPSLRAAAASPALQQRIDSLLKHRLKPEPLPVNPPNPFQMIGTAKRESGSEESVSRATASREEIIAATPPATDSAAKDLTATQQSETLISCATRLKLGGVIILKDQIQIVVNGVPRKEGDVVAADWNNSIVYLKIARLLPGQMVLRYGEAEATVKF